MKSFVKIIFFIASLGWACSDFEDPARILTDRLSFFSLGQYQTGFAGEYLTDSIMIRVSDDINYTDVSGMKVLFEVIEGGGELETTSGYTDRRGICATRWKLGFDSNLQTLRVTIYTADDEYRGSQTIYATSLVKNGWNLFNNSIESRIRDMICDTISKTTLAIIDGTLYRQTEGFFNWEPVNEYYINQPRAFNKGDDGTFYLTTWEGFVYKSTNNGVSWSVCNKPFPDRPYYIDLRVTSDNYLWASAWGYGLTCSRDGGETWQKDTLGLESEDLLGDIYRLSDGTYLLGSEGYFNLHRSVDDGHTWTKLDAPQFSLKLFITDDDELIMINQDHGYSLYKSTDMGAHFELKASFHAAFGTSMFHTVHKWRGWYYILIPGHGIQKTADFEKFTTFWRNEKALDMFFDANGNIVVLLYNFNGIYYYDNPENQD